MLDFLSLRFGYYGDFVFNRKLKVDGRGTGFHKNISSTKLFTNAGYLVLNICDRVDLFSTLGETRLSVATNGLTWSRAANYQTYFNSKESFSWSAGARLMLLHRGPWLLGMEGQYFTSHCPIDFFSNYVDERARYPRNHSKYLEWQLGVGLSYTICPCSAFTVVPYTGLKWDKCKYITHQFRFIDGSGIANTIFNLKAQRYWGIPLGVTVMFNAAFSLEVETRWLDERAFTAKAQMQF